MEINWVLLIFISLSIFLDNDMNNNMKKIIFKINDYKKNKEKYGYSLSFNDSTIFNFLILPENIKLTRIETTYVIKNVIINVLREMFAFK